MKSKQSHHNTYLYGLECQLFMHHEGQGQKQLGMKCTFYFSNEKTVFDSLNKKTMLHT